MKLVQIAQDLYPPAGLRRADDCEGVDHACTMTPVTPLTDDPDMREMLEAAAGTFFVG